MNKWQSLVFGVALGAALALVGVYLYGGEYRRFAAHSPFVSAASQARLDVAVLRKLRSGDAAGASVLMEERLRINETTLSEYQTAYPAHDRDKAVEAAAAAVAEYRSEQLK